MGSNVCIEYQAPSPKPVTYLPNSLPEDNKYKVYDSDSLRFCDISATKSQRNQYLFTMKMSNEIDIRECVPVLNEILSCVGYENYELKIESQMIIDIFDSQLASTLMNVRNEKNLSQFSMKIIPFLSYNSIEFKKGLYEVYLNKQLGVKASTMRLLDYFIYGINMDQQAFIFLFERCLTSLANIAEYRKQGNIPWSLPQKIRIIHEILSSYQSINQRNIIHRDLRPSNIFYSYHSGKFVIGNFSRARLLRRNYEHHRMTVCGVPNFSCQEMQMLILQGLEVGEYEGIDQDYSGIKSILNLIETCQIYDNDPTFGSPQMNNIVNMITRHAQIRVVLKQIQRLAANANIDLNQDAGERRDKSIGETCSFLLAHTHKNVIEDRMFEANGCLGYMKSYAQKADKMMQRNKQMNKEDENAPILRNLGDFTESKNGDGTQLYYNSFLLYIHRAEKQLSYGYLERAERNLEHAKEIYFKFSQVIQSQTPRIQINRISALVFLEENDLENAIRIFNDSFVKAASKSNVSVEKQCDILLTYGKIYTRIPQIRDDALKKLTIGLNICENFAAFKSATSSKVYKSRFMKQIGIFYLKSLQLKTDPRIKQKTPQQITSNEQAQTYLKSALQIEQREAVDDLQVANTLQYLGRLAYLQHNFHEAKRYYDAAKVRNAHMKHLINPMKQIHVLYMRGTCCYYLKQLNEAKIDYQTCLMRLEKLPQTSSNQILVYNIHGNLGLVLMEIGDSSGKGIMERALNQIKEVKGENSYDYATIYQHYLNAMKS